MTAYVYTPYCAVPAPYYNGSSGNTGVLIWGAGIRAGTYPIRIVRIESGVTSGQFIYMYRVNSATMNNSSLAGTITPVDLRQSSPAPTCTTACGTAVSNFTGSGYTYTISGAIPSGTFQFLGGCPPGSFSNAVSGSSANYSVSNYAFASEVIINPGSAFWMGSNVTASGAGGLLTYNGSYVASSSRTTASAETVSPTNIYFEELQEDWTH